MGYSYLQKPHSERGREFKVSPICLRTAVRIIVADSHDATLAEFCELFASKTGNWVGKSAMCSALQKLGLNRKKK